MRNVVWAALIGLVLAAGDALAAGGGGASSGLTGGATSGLPGGPGSPLNGGPPGSLLPPGSGTGPASTKSGGMVTSLSDSDKPESKSASALGQANAALKEAFSRVQADMTRSLTQALESLRNSVN